MIEIKDKSKCTGCHACYSKCPKNCIDMVEDKEGFLYPKVKNEKCISCGLCLRICPVLNKIQSLKVINVYGAYNKNSDTRIKSSSGGIFSLISQEFLYNKGISFGAIYDNDFNVVHSYIEHEDEIYKLRGSKYYQSIIGNSFKIAKENLEKNRQVIFTGTPCQIAGVKSFLQKDYENLICIDIACHGVPSNKIFKKYINEVSKNSEIESINFRDKSISWNDYSLKVNYKNKEGFTQLSKDNLYMQGFVNDYYLRPSCYECRFKGIERYGDITLADFWGVDKIKPNLYDKKGVSLIFINSEKGLNLFNKIKDNIYYEDVNIKEAIEYNVSIINSPQKKQKREIFFKYIDKVTFSQAMELASINSNTNRIKNYLKFRIYNLKK
ncbi:Coenzyme F420 hydrogenase/dehydrogenase, beta subunit C-terminal domain [Intestinibacter bartlettii]|uniref:Coenzyme F420 hydrogenase/dehydrogenase, beta subunit C-terminal domain n=1 Tax=Intestinibacter bartlettii TaxID=261299 RepID=UPI0039916242